VAKNHPSEVVTPETLAMAIESDREIMDKRMQRKDGKKAFKEARRQEGQSSRGNKKKFKSADKFVKKRKD
jgi:uncharacterized protein (UPF0218 family)